MRFNFFQYHVQNRQYNSDEIYGLVNHYTGTHSRLTGEVFSFYSLGSTVEAAITIPSIGTLFTAALAGVNLFVVPLIFYAYRYINAPYNSIYIGDDSYSGTEVTAFLNGHYDVIVGSNRDSQYERILSDFLHHEYIDAVVPTSSWFDFSIAVLDEVVSELAGISPEEYDEL
jgi:hypothetical protein